MNELGQINSQYRCLLTKLQQLIRVYKIAKKNDKNNALQERVKAKSSEIISRLKTFPSFTDIEEIYTSRIEAAFKETKQEVPSSAKSSREQVQAPKSKIAQPPKKNNFSSMSSFSSNSNASANMTPAPKKQMPIIEQKPKPPPFAQKHKIQPPKSAQGFKSDLIQPIRVPETSSKASSSPKIETDSISSKSNHSLQEAKKEGSSISSIQKKQFFQKEKSSRGSHESFLGLLDQNSSSESEFNLKLQPQKLSEQKIETPQPSHHSQTPRQDEFDKLSQTSGIENTAQTITSFCKDNKDRLNTEIIFNEDIFDYIHDEEQDFIYLIGVNKPQGKKVQKLYTCTLMKFSIHEVMKCDELFEKETKDFKNNIRTPIGLIMKGDGPSAIQPEHIKFLVNLQCPFLVILVLKDLQKYDGVLCHFNQNVVDRIRFTPRKQLGQAADELSKKTYVLPFNESYLPKEKTRYVITKHLNRTIVSNAEQAPNAITISDNQCIREEKNPFSYKVHQKFLTSLKTEHTIYYVNGGIANARLSYKNFQSFKAEALTLKPTFPLIFSLTLARDNIPIKKQFFEVLLQCNKIRDPNIFLNLSNMGAKKCIVVTLRPDVTQEMLDKVQPIQLKNFEKDTQLTYFVLAISKNNIKDFEDPKAEIVEHKAPV